MKKFLLTLVTLAALLLASFVFVGGAAADENAPHACYLAGLTIFPGETLRSQIYDVNGIVVFDYTQTNNGSVPIFVPGDVYVPAVSGTETVTITGPFGSFTFSYNVNDFTSGACFNDGRINSRPDRDNAAPVAIYVRATYVDIYDINQVAGTGTLAITATLAELEAGWEEALSSGGNVVVGQVADMTLFVLASSTADYAVCQVNATEAREGKSYEFRWICVV